MMLKSISAPRSLMVRASRTRTTVVRAQENQGKVVREFREDDGTITGPGASKPKDLYADPKSGDGFFVNKPMSKDQRSRLREEYLAWGGSADKPMSTNWFLWIILVISFLAILSGALGYLG